MIVVGDLAHCSSGNVEMLDPKSNASPSQQSEVSTHMLAEDQWILGFSLGRHEKDNGQVQWQTGRPTCILLRTSVARCL